MNELRPSTRIHGLDTLRALAIIFVLMTHYAGFASHESTFGVFGDIGWVGVDLFFALSGYLIGNQIFTALRSGQPFSLRHFYARRLLRTLPNFYVVLALYACWPGFHGKAVLPPLWKFLTFTQNYQLTVGTAFSHAWSLCIEEQFYMLLPAAALLIAGLRSSLRWAWFAIGASLVAGMVMRALWWNAVDASDASVVSYYQNIYYSSFCRFDELVAGVALALLKNYHGQLWQRLTQRGNAILAAGIGATVLTFYLLLADRFGFALTVFGYPLLALCFALLIAAALAPGSLLQRTRVPGAASLALWSYALYLVHKQIFILANGPLRELGYPASGWPGIAILMGASVLAAALLYRCVEMPFMALRAKIVPSNVAAPGASAFRTAPPSAS
ncbi:MAG: acyltransferase [Pseudomonadota bacterium]